MGMPVRNILPAKNFPNLLKNSSFHMQEIEQTPSRINTKKTTNTNIIQKLIKATKKNTLRKP